MIWAALYFLIAFVVFCWMAYEGEDVSDSLLAIVWPLLAVVLSVLWVHEKLYDLGRKRRNNYKF